MKLNRVIVAACAGLVAAVLFPARASADTEHILLNYHSVLCGSPGESWDPAVNLAGTHLSQHGCDPDHTEQIWLFTAPQVFNGVTYIHIRNAQSGMCMAVDGGTTTPGPYVIQWPCGSWSDHYWRIVDVGGGLYRIINHNSQLCLGVDGGSTAEGALLIQWPCGPWADHFWRL
jgi:Ricin-type beta-trefoil lectin domain-like